MMYQFGNKLYNLSKVIQLRNMAGMLKPEYAFYSKDRAETRWCFGLFVDHPARKAGFYRYGESSEKYQMIPCTQEEATYGPEVVQVWFDPATLHYDSGGLRFHFDNAAEAEDFIRKCEKAADLRCKF